MTESLILFTAIAVLVLIERVPAARFEALPVRRRYAGTDVIYLFTSGLALSFAARELAARYLAPASGFAATAALLGCSLVLFDLGAYAAHRLLHRFDFLWELHKIHHSSRVLDWLATFRGHIAEHVLRQLLSPVLLIAVGVPLSIVGLTAAINGAWAAFVHSNIRLRLRFLDPLFITPRLHRLHHTAANCERNFSAMFSIWDRLSGTLETDAEGQCGPLGVPGEEDTYPQTWGVQLVEPIRRRRPQPGDRGLQNPDAVRIMPAKQVSP
jgi:sterol desaturase/sphingolipid hydroxylase (fatty acid hydroxylase superfamily)